MGAPASVEDMHTITIWSDLTCPWAFVAATRLHRTRDVLGADDVAFDFRAAPRELTGSMPGEARVRAEVAALAQHETRLFSNYDAAAWPQSSLPAWEAQRWGYSLGQEVGERFDLALRRGFFLHAHNIGLRSELLAVATAEGFDAAALGRALDTGAFRSEVAADVADADEAGVKETPRVDLPDGSSHVNPGMTISWVRGIPVISGDHPSVYEDLVRIAAFGD